MFDHKLAISMNVFNAFNERVPTSYYQYSEDPGPGVVNNDYMLPIGYTTPRYVQFSVSYDY
jgi:outer membrane receptor protein involved in Fe transport